MAERHHRCERLPTSPAIPSASGHCGKKGRSVGNPVRRRGAGHRLGQGAKTSPVAIRPRLPEAGHADNDQAGVQGEKDLRSKTPLLERAGTEALDQDMRRRNETTHELCPAWVREEERDRSLVAPEERPPQRLLVLAPAPAAQAVAFGVLDLDHVGTEVAHQGADQGAGVDGGSVDHADTAKRPLPAQFGDASRSRSRRRMASGGHSSSTTALLHHASMPSPVVTQTSGRAVM